MDEAPWQGGNRERALEAVVAQLRAGDGPTSPKPAGPPGREISAEMAQRYRENSPARYTSRRRRGQ